jgi:hypothetical protein
LSRTSVQNRQEHQDESDANRLVIIEGSPLGLPVAKTFASIDEAEGFVMTRIRANVMPEMRERFEKAVADKVVSEDGVKAVSEVIAGKLTFLRALATAYAPKIAITTRRYDEEDDARR